MALVDDRTPDSRVEEMTWFELRYIWDALRALGDLLEPELDQIDSLQLQIDATASALTVLEATLNYEIGIWTPVVTSQSGTITSYNAKGRYTRVGDTIHAWVEIQITNAGSGAGQLIATLAVASDSTTIYGGTGSELAMTGWALSTWVEPDSNLIKVQKYDASTIIATGRSVFLQYTYPAGVAIVDPGAGADASLALAYATSFKTTAHQAHLGLVPGFFDWSNTGRHYANDYMTTNGPTTHKYFVPWMHAFANDVNIWPTDVGVEIGVHEVWGRLISTGLWVLVQSWPTLNAHKHNRDDHGYNGGVPVPENHNTAPTGPDTMKTTSTGTKVVRRHNNVTFPTQGTNIHGFFLEADGSSRPYLDRTLFSNVAIRGRYRAVGWPASDGLAPILNPASNATENKVLVGVGSDCYLDVLGPYNTSYGGDLGIPRYVFLKQAWMYIHWYAGLSGSFSANPPPYIQP